MPLWIPVAFGAIVLWVIGNLIDKYLIERFRGDDNDTDAGMLFLFSSLFVAPVALLALYMGAAVVIDPAARLIATLSGVLNGAYLFCYLLAISRSEISRTAPIFQSIPLFTAFFGWLFLSQTLTQTEMLAGLFIVVGALLLSYHHSNSRFLWVPAALMVCAAACESLQFVVFKFSAMDLGYWTSIFWNSVGLIMFGAIVYLLNPRSREHFNRIFTGRQYRVLALNFGNEIVDNAAMMTYLFATMLGPLGLVQIVTAYHPVILLIATTVATKLGFTMLNEDIDRRELMQKILGIICVGIGSAFIYVPLIGES